MTTRRNISSASPFEPVIGFSRAVRVGNVVAVGGTAPIAPDGKTVGVGDPAAQTRRCIEVIRAALKEAGASLGDVVRTRTFFTRREDWEVIGRVHGEVFHFIRPASTMAVVAGLIDPDWLVEMEADAVVEDHGEERDMTAEELRKAKVPPGDENGLVAALWHASQDNWQKAHELVQAIESAEAAWVHAYLHRVEGDLANARYWYNRAGKPEARMSTEEEWKQLAEALMLEGGL